MSSARSQATSYARGYDRYPQQQDVSAEGCEVATRVHRSVGKWRMHPRENKVGEGLRELRVETTAMGTGACSVRWSLDCSLAMQDVTCEGRS